MSKILTLWRHAEAQEKQENQSDTTRRLTEKGLQDATRIGDVLRASGLPDHAVCSPAARTRETLAALKDPIPPTELQDMVYLASAGELITCLQQMDDANTHILLVGHNPGLKQLVDSLMMMTENVEDTHVLSLRMGLPPCALVTLRLNIERWEELAPGVGTLTAYTNPEILAAENS